MAPFFTVFAFPAFFLALRINQSVPFFTVFAFVLVLEIESELHNEWPDLLNIILNGFFAIYHTFTFYTCFCLIQDSLAKTR